MNLIVRLLIRNIGNIEVPIVMQLRLLITKKQVYGRENNGRCKAAQHKLKKFFWHPSYHHTNPLYVVTSPYLGRTWGEIKIEKVKIQPKILKRDKLTLKRVNKNWGSVDEDPERIFPSRSSLSSPQDSKLNCHTPPWVLQNGHT